VARQKSDPLIVQGVDKTLLPHQGGESIARSFFPIVITRNENRACLGAPHPFDLHGEDGIRLVAGGRPFRRHASGLVVVAQDQDGAWICRLSYAVAKEGSYRVVEAGLYGAIDKKKRMLRLRAR